MSDKHEIARSAGMIGFLTLLSRITGYIRDMVMAYFFGATAFTDAFWIAFRIPNLLRRLFAEGSLTISFIPIFTEMLEKRDKEEAKKVSDIVFSLLFTITIIVSILGVIFSPYIVKLFAYGFDRETFETLGRAQQDNVPIHILRFPDRPIHGGAELAQAFFRPRIFSGAPEHIHDNCHIRTF